MRPRLVIVFAHGSGSSRHSPRNRYVAERLHHRAGMATLLMDLLTVTEDEVVLGLNQSVLRQLPPSARLEEVPGATHLFEEPGTLEAVAALAAQWFHTHLPVLARSHAT